MSFTSTPKTIIIQESRLPNLLSLLRRGRTISRRARRKSLRRKRIAGRACGGRCRSIEEVACVELRDNVVKKSLWGASDFDKPDSCDMELAAEILRERSYR